MTTMTEAQTYLTVRAECEDDDLVKSTMLCKMCKKALLEHLLALHSGRANWMVVNECCKQLIKEKYFSISILLLNLFVVFSISSVTSSG